MAMVVSDELAVTLYRRYGKEYKQGDILFKEGDVAEEMYIITAGRVRIVKQNVTDGKDKVQSVEKTLAILDEGQMLGEMAIINKERRSATAIVDEPARILVIDQATFYAMIRNNAEFSMMFLSILSNRLRDANIRTTTTGEKSKQVAHLFKGLVEILQTHPNDPIDLDVFGKKQIESGVVSYDQFHFLIDNLLEAGIAKRKANLLFIMSADEIKKFSTFLELL